MDLKNAKTIKRTVIVLYLRIFKMKKTVLLILLFGFLIPAIIEAQFYNRNTYRTQRHEISLGFGASSCLTDIGGGGDDGGSDPTSPGGPQSMGSAQGGAGGRPY